MQKTQINPEIAQQMLESAPNAADKGQSQYFTPLDFGTAVAAPLPKLRPTIVDLNCGAGHLLHASAVKSTLRLLGADINPCHRGRVETTAPLHRITYDLTLLYPILAELNWQADLFVLNPPWRLFWHRDRLADLAHSTLGSVRRAFAAAEDPFGGACPKHCLDSTIATLLIALDRCTDFGEGLLIANHATLQRLLFDAAAPYAPLAQHCWARLVVPGNPMTGITGCNFEDQMQTEVLYFARGHTAGPRLYKVPDPDSQPSSPTGAVLNPQLLPDRVYRQGAELRDAYYASDSTVELWQAARERVGELEGNKPKTPWNLWLAADGTIRTALSTFEKHSTRLNKAEAERLFALNGQHPIELVLQRNTRDELLRTAGVSPTPPPSNPQKVAAPHWRVDPALIRAIQSAVAEYHRARAPLYPLPEIQRLGYLDEEDTITCQCDLARGPVLFRSGQSYPLRTQTVPVQRRVWRPNAMTGDDEELEYSGQELAFLITANEVEYCFMDQKLRDDTTVQLENPKRVKDIDARARATVQKPKAEAVIDFTLQDLVNHFTIPDVPDVAAINPTGYQDNLNLLRQLETLTTL